MSLAKSKTERGRFSSRKKVEAVLRVLRGEDLDLVSREAGITAAKISQWWDQFVASGQAGLKSLAADGRDDELAHRPFPISTPVVYTSAGVPSDGCLSCLAIHRSAFECSELDQRVRQEVGSGLAVMHQLTSPFSRRQRARLAAEDPIVCRQFMTVLNLLASPVSPFSPPIAWRVLTLRRPSVELAPPHSAAASSA